MRWKKRTPKSKKERSVGEERIIYHFAIFPVLIDEEWVWLERYKEICIWQPNDPLRLFSKNSWHFSHKETIKRQV